MHVSNQGNRTADRRIKQLVSLLFVVGLLPMAVAQPVANQAPANQRTTYQVLSQSKAARERAVWFTQTPQFNQDSTVAYYTKAIALLRTIQPIPYTELTDVYVALSDYHYRFYKYTESGVAATAAWESSQKIIQQPPGINLLNYRVLRSRAFAELENGVAEQSIKLMEKALALLQSDSRPTIQALMLKDKGILYSRYYSGIESKAAITFLALEKSRKFYEASSNSLYNEPICDIYKSLIWYYNVKDQRDSCDAYFSKLERLLPVMKSPVLTGWYYALRGNTLSRRKQYGEANKLVNKSLALMKRYKLTTTNLYRFSLNVMGFIAQKENRYTDAVAYYDQGYKVALATSRPNSIMSHAEHLTSLYEQKGDLKQGLFYYKQWANEMIKFTEAHSEKSLRESELQLNISSQQKQLAEQHAERSSFLTAIAVTVLITVLLTIILVSLYRTFKSKQRVNQQLELLNNDLATKNTLLDKRNADNELLLKEIHHRVKNNLQVVSSLLALQSARITDPDVQAAMLASQNRVQSMGILHQKLYQSEQLAFIEMRQYFVNLSENILDSYNVSSRITVDCPMPELELDVDTAVPVGLIVNELLTNALKYAFPKEQLGAVRLVLEDLGQNRLHLCVSDNGIGKPTSGSPQGTGFGTQLVELLTRQLNGILHQDGTNGTTISIHFSKVRLAS